MRILINERQYRVLLKEDKIENTKNKFVFTDDNLNTFLEKMKLGSLEDQSDEKKVMITIPGKGTFPKLLERIDPIVDNRGNTIAYIIVNKKGKMSVKFTEEIFNDIVNADPSRGKKYIKWIIGIALAHIDPDDDTFFIRFITEDLDTVKNNLILFHDIKDTGTFKSRMKNYSVAEIRENPSDIFKYNLSNLKTVMGIFKKTEGVYGNMKQKMEEHVTLGSAKYIYEDDDVLVYEPLTRDSSCDPFSEITNVCVSNPGNSYFNRYSQEDHPLPTINPETGKNDPSRYYYIVPKALQFGKDATELGEKDYTQYYPLLFHFESNQLHDRDNDALIGYENISPSRDYSNYSVSDLLNEFPDIKEFFSRELGGYVNMDIKSGNSLMNNQGSNYGKYLNLFGGNIKNHVSKDDYKKGVEQIKRSAKDKNNMSKGVKENKYLMWLLENEDDIQLSDYLTNDSIPDDISLILSNVNFATFPDLSHITKVTQLAVEKCGLTELPDPSLLPPNLFVIQATNNNITTIDFSGYNILKGLHIINIGKNPTDPSINLDSIEEFSQTEEFMMISFPNLVENKKNEVINEIEKYSDKITYSFK
jgi:hypothetical protein